MIDILRPFFEKLPVTEEISTEERNLFSVAYKNAVGLNASHGVPPKKLLPPKSSPLSKATSKTMLKHLKKNA